MRYVTVGGKTFPVTHQQIIPDGVMAYGFVEGPSEFVHWCIYNHRGEPLVHGYERATDTGSAGLAHASAIRLVERYLGLTSV